MVLLFALTIFLGAALLFLVEPMAAKSILPLLGGSPAVWNTAMVFFQAALLAGYFSAHVLGRTGRRMQVVAYAAAVAAPIVASLLLHRLIVDLPAGWSAPTRGSPVLWALGLLGVMIGPPFVVLSAAGPLLQRWFSGTSHRSARDPYFLYVASNAGSMAGLLAYPLLVEPLLPLSAQRWAWSVAFGVFAIFAGVCGAVFQRTAGRVRALPTAAPSGAATPISWRTRLYWIVLALVPSSLMLGVTQYLSTDIAAVPLLWVIPLAVYLLTFIIAFANPAPVRSGEVGKVLPVMLVALAVAFMIRGFHLPPVALFALHLLGLLLVGLWCHTRLAESRPPSERLTEFYLWVAVGGVLGGCFNALAAPVLFPLVIEYPLMIVGVCLLRIQPARPPARDWAEALLDAAVAVLVGVLAATLDGILRRAPFDGLLKGVSSVLLLKNDGDASLRLALSIGLPVFLLYLTKKRPTRFAIAMAAVLAAAFLRTGPGSAILHIERTFFGVYRVEQNPWQTWLTHGTTLHGLQSRDPAKQATPLSYYHPDGPAGGVFAAYGPTLGDRVGLVGMGTGALAAYARTGQRYTFHEIDPAVVRIAENPAYFTYLRDCRARGAAYDVMLGDGRLTMAEVPDGEYGIIVLDAFSSDSIPVHLLTREAMSLYLQKLRPGGVLAFHVSNQYMKLAPVVAREAAALNGAALIWEDDAEKDELLLTGRYPSVWVAVAHRREDLAPLTTDGRWRPPAILPGTPLWTDDYSNVLGVLGKSKE